jgi:hypothetical protein
MCRFLLTNGPRATTYWGVGLNGHNSWPSTANLSDTQTGGGKHASKEKGCKEEEVTTEHLQVSSFPRPASPSGPCFRGSWDPLGKSGHEAENGRVRWETNGCILEAAGRPKGGFVLRYHQQPYSNAEGGSRNNMIQYMICVIGCLFFIAVIAVYFPTIYIRKTDKILKILQQIEANSRKP